jgi:hypothetical protein
MTNSRERFEVGELTKTFNRQRDDWRAEHDAFAKQRGKALYEEWLASVQARCEKQASDEFRATARPEPTFRALATKHALQRAPKPDKDLDPARVLAFEANQRANIELHVDRLVAIYENEIVPQIEQENMRIAKFMSQFGPMDQRP